MVEREKFGLAQERSRVQTLLQGMQDLMNVYNSAATANCITSPPPPPPPFTTPMSMLTSSSTGC